MTPLQHEIELFFGRPDRDPDLGNPEGYGTLHALRRDIRKCIKPRAMSRNGRDSRVLWLGAIGILVGIDLLGKFLEGNASAGDRAVERRFKGFVRRYISLHEATKGQKDREAEALYRLRNALLHSYGLACASVSGETSYSFTLTARGGCLCGERARHEWHVDILSLYERFERGLVAYRDDLLSGRRKDNGESPLDCFGRMYSTYGKQKVCAVQPAGGRVPAAQPRLDRGDKVEITVTRGTRSS